MDVAALWAGVGESRALSRGRPAAGAAHRGRRRGALRHRRARPGDRRRRRQGRVLRRRRRGVRPGRSARTGGARRSGPRPAWAGRPCRPGRSSTAAWSAAARRSATGPALLGRRSSFVAMPMGGRRLYCYADETADPDDAEPGRPAGPRARAVRRRSAARCRPSSTAMEKVQVARTDEVVLDAWSTGPVLLVGDAAHATAPTLAQGAAHVVRGRGGARRGAARHARRHPGRAAARTRPAVGPAAAQVRERTRERDRTRDVPPALRDPMLRRRGRGSSRTSTGSSRRAAAEATPRAFGHPAPVGGRRGTILPARYACSLADVLRGRTRHRRLFRDDRRA